MKLWESTRMWRGRSRASDEWRVRVGRGSEWALCAAELREWFHIPEKAKSLWVVVHDRPAKDRVEIVGFDAGRLLLGDDERGPKAIVSWWGDEQVERFLAQNHGRPIYAEIWYEVEQ